MALPRPPWRVSRGTPLPPRPAGLGARPSPRSAGSPPHSRPARCGGVACRLQPLRTPRAPLLGRRCLHPPPRAPQATSLRSRGPNPELALSGSLSDLASPTRAPSERPDHPRRWVPQARCSVPPTPRTPRAGRRGLDDASTRGHPLCPHGDPPPGRRVRPALLGLSRSAHAAPPVRLRALPPAPTGRQPTRGPLRLPPVALPAHQAGCPLAGRPHPRPACALRRGPASCRHPRPQECPAPPRRGPRTPPHQEDSATARVPRETVPSSKPPAGQRPLLALLRASSRLGSAPTRSRGMPGAQPDAGPQPCVTMVGAAAHRDAAGTPRGADHVHAS